MGTTPRREKRLAARGFATKGEERSHRMKTRTLTATTAEEQTAAAYDWWRSAVHHSEPAGRSGRYRRIAQLLMSEAQAIEKGGD